MSSHLERADAKKPARIPIHLVSFGETIPFADKVLEENSASNTFVWAPGYDALREALADGAKTNIIFLNIAYSSYAEHLDANESFIRARSPLVVAPDEYRDQISKGIIAKYDIKLIPSFSDRHFIRDLPSRLQELLQQRARDGKS